MFFFPTVALAAERVNKVNTCPLLWLLSCLQCCQTILSKMRDIRALTINEMRDAQNGPRFYCIL